MLGGKKVESSTRGHSQVAAIGGENHLRFIANRAGSDSRVPNRRATKREQP
jgi:hypothetical protein